MHFPVFWPAVKVHSSQRTDKAQNYSTQQHVLYFSKISSALLGAKAHTTPSVVGGSNQRQEDKNKVSLRVSLA